MLGWFAAAIGPRLAAAALNGLDQNGVDEIVAQQLDRVRQLIWVDVAHLERPGLPTEAPRPCISTDGPCHVWAPKATATEHVLGIVPSAFLGKHAHVALSDTETKSLNALVGTAAGGLSLPRSLRTVHQLKKPLSYAHWRQDPQPPPTQIPRGTFHFAELSSRPPGEPLPSNFSLGLPAGVRSTTAEWLGDWQTTGGLAVRLSGGSGHLRFSQRMFIDAFPIGPCGREKVAKQNAVGPAVVVIVGRQGLAPVWVRTVQLANCHLRGGWIDIMEFNASLHSVDEVFIAASGGTDVCLGPVSVRAFMGNIRIVDGVVEAASAQNLSSDSPDIEHDALVMYPVAQAQQLGGSYWGLQPTRLSTSATSRLVSLSHAHKHGWRLRSYPASGGQRCLARGSIALAEIFPEAAGLLFGDDDQAGKRRPAAPSWSQGLRRKGLQALKGSVGRVCAARWRCSVRNIRAALRNASWLGLHRRGRMPGEGPYATQFLQAKQQQHMVDELVALQLEKEDSFNHKQPLSPALSQHRPVTTDSAFPADFGKGPASVRRAAAPRRCFSACSWPLLPAPMPRLLLPAPSPRPLLPAPVPELSLPTQISTFKPSLW